MYKKILLFLLICLVLTGCTPEADENEYSDDTSNEIVESLGCAEVYQVQGALLVVEQTETEDDNELILKKISIEDESFLEEKRFSAGKDWDLQIGANNIALLDYTKKQVLVLDEQLNVIKEYDINEKYEQWYLDSEMEKIYLFDFQQGITVMETEGEIEQILLDDIADMKVYNYGSFQVFFSYVDKTSQQIKNKVLELNAGMMENIPLDKELADANHYAGIWFLKEENSEKNLYSVVAEEKIKEVECKDGELRLLGSKRHLLYINEQKNLLTLYDLDGAFVSQFALEENLEHSISNNFVWSGYSQGYYFTDTTKDGTSLKFWDPNVSSEGEDLIFSAEKEFIVEEMTIPELKECAKAISEKYSVDIYLGDECLLDYSAYTAAVLEDTSLISQSLDMLEHSLSKYPEDFMKQLQFGAITSIRIEIVSSLALKNHMEDGIEAAAFAEEKHDYLLLVFDANQLAETTVHHEIAHLIDKRLEWENVVRDDAMFNEEAWLKLQPEGFDYAYSYEQEVISQIYDESYFVSEYSCTYPTEDRATMMEKAMMGLDEEFEDKPKLKEKLEYYSKCIRDCFDTEKWTEKDFGS